MKQQTQLKIVNNNLGTGSETAPEAIRIMIVDNETLVRHRIALMLADEADLKLVCLAGSGEEALLKAQINPVDVIILDVNLPGMGGIEAIRHLQQQFPTIRILALDAHPFGDTWLQALEAGVHGFITKSASVAELLEAIRGVNDGRKYLASHVARQARKFESRDVGPSFRKLSRRELQIALLCCDGEKISQIARILSLSPKTVYTYRYRIFDKLGVRTDVQISRLARQEGLQASEARLLLAKSGRQCA